MRTRVFWAAALALLLFVLALGLSALAGAAEPRSGEARDLGGPAPSLPASSWSRVASMPESLHGAAGVSNGTYAYAAGGVNAGGRLWTPSTATTRSTSGGTPIRRRCSPIWRMRPLSTFRPTIRTTRTAFTSSAARTGTRSATPAGSSTSRRTHGPPSRTCLPRVPGWRPATTAPTGGSTWSAGPTPPAHRQRSGSTSPAPTRSPPTARRSRTRWPVLPPESSPAISTWQAGTTHPLS